MRPRSNALYLGDPRMPNHEKPNYIIPVPQNAGPYRRDPMNRAFMDFYGTRTHPGEGWKFHISVHAIGAEALANVVLPALTQQNIWHKYIDKPYVLGHLGGTQVGKFIVVYSISTDDASNIIQRLRPFLRNLQGPPIRAEALVGGTTVLYARYGGFVSKFILCPHGKKVRDNRRRTAPPWAVPYTGHLNYDFPVYSHRTINHTNWCGPCRML